MRIVRLTMAGLLGASALTALSFGGGASIAQASTATSLAACKTTIGSQEYAKGTLTVATDTPAYAPWFEHNKPSNGKGYESAVAYAIAKELGVKSSNVNWVVEPFDNSYVPGVKKFDFDINEISYTAARAKAVTFSTSYYDVQQSIVALKTSTIVKKHSAAELKTYQYGDQIGTTGLAYIENEIQPTKQPRVYSTLDQVEAALESGQIDAFVIDTPTGQYEASADITKNKKLVATQVAQFPSVGEHYGLLFAKGNHLVTCVDTAIAALTTNGTLASLQKKWLGIYTDVPVIKP